AAGGDGDPRLHGSPPEPPRHTGKGPDSKVPSSRRDERSGAGALRSPLRPALAPTTGSLPAPGDGRGKTIHSVAVAARRRAVSPPRPSAPAATARRRATVVGQTASSYLLQGWRFPPGSPHSNTPLQTHLWGVLPNLGRLVAWQPA